jgi:endonuclease/exonuclease/phosphatase (EEP) superfamily protein YafD
MVWKFTRNYLDHGFVRGLKVLSAEVLADARGSDHKPMVLELALEQ